MSTNGETVPEEKEKEDPQKTADNLVQMALSSMDQSISLKRKAKTAAQKITQKCTESTDLELRRAAGAKA